jgi:hypothetical protein
MTAPIERAIQALGVVIDEASYLELQDGIRAALIAIREPSDAMIEAGAKKIPGSEARTCAAMCWRAMWDAMVME